MKKILVLSMMLLLTACACYSESCRKKQEAQAQASSAEQVPVKEAETEVAPRMYAGEVEASADAPVVVAVTGDDVAVNNPVMVSETLPVASEVSGSYGCAVKANCQTLEPIVLKPRVTEVVGSENKRPCCDDNAWLLDENPETYVPDAPEIYVIAANRAFNTMQEEAAPLFRQIGKMKVYVGEATPISEDLPGGMDKGMVVLKKRLEQMKNVEVVKNKFTADYRIDSNADWYDTPTKTVPAVKYNITFKDKSGNLIGEWSEIIHQAEGDRSWW